MTPKMTDKECCDKARAEGYFNDVGGRTDKWGFPLCCQGRGVVCVDADLLFKGQKRPTSQWAERVMILCAKAHEKTHLDKHSAPCPPHVDLQFPPDPPGGLPPKFECEAYTAQFECLKEHWDSFCGRHLTVRMMRKCREEVLAHLNTLVLTANANYGCGFQFFDFEQIG
jgi:hypothetical protein